MTDALFARDMLTPPGTANSKRAVEMTSCAEKMTGEVEKVGVALAAQLDESVTLGDGAGVPDNDGLAV